MISLVDLSRTLCNLRILELRSDNITTLPDSIGALMHLRYFRACCTITTIPESIGYLRKLITLDLSDCDKLQHVPSSIINLKQLRFLYLPNANAKAIPAGLKILENLVYLVGFKPSKNGSEGFSSLDELENLNHLVGLSLHNLENVTDKNMAKRANLQCKNKLKGLGLNYLDSDGELETKTNARTAEEILNELCPPPSIELLVIASYFGSCLPHWLYLGTTLSNLKTLEIYYCECLENLPALGQLPNLFNLKIIGASSVLSIGEELLWGDIKSSCITFPAFPKLSELKFQAMPKWREWQWNKGESAMPRLKELTIINCPLFRSFPDGLLHHATLLEKLKITDCESMTTVENLLSIKDIQFYRNSNLKRISNLPKVSHVIIEDCSLLKIVEKLNVLQRLEYRRNYGDSLPEYLMTITPQKLRIHCTEELLWKIASQKESGSEWHKFEHIPHVAIYSMYNSNYAIYQKDPFSFTTHITQHD